MSQADGPSPLPLVGREREFEAMRRFVEAHIAREATPRVLFVCGACGGGKTTTLQRVMASDFTHAPLLEKCGVEQRLRRPGFHHLNCADMSRPEFLVAVAAILRGALTARRRAAGTAARSRQRRAACAAVRLDDIDAAFQALAAANRPLQVIAIDEAEFARSPKVVQDVTLSALAHGGRAVCVVLITNSRAAGFLRPDEFVELTFESYTVEQLTAIASVDSPGGGGGSGVVRGVVVANGTGREGAATDSAVATASPPMPRVTLSRGAADYAAKVAVTRYSADARKVLAICRNAVAAKERTTDSGSTAPTGIPGHARAPHEEPQGARLAASTAVNVGDLVGSILDAPTTNVPTIRTLPKQMLLILCCCVNYARREQQQQPQQRDCAIDVRGLYAMYQQLMRHLSVPPQSQAHVRESLSGLADYGLVTPLNSKGLFALVTRIDEVVAALRAEGRMFTIAGQVIEAA